MTHRVTRLYRHGESGYVFTINGRRYRTNTAGEGLWVFTRHPGANYDVFQQIRGTCQFDLTGLNRRQVLRYIHKFLDNDIT